MKLTGAGITIDRLCAHGVKTVFGFPGGQVLPLYDALYKNSHRIKHILTAHEQGAAHAADGFARASGTTGVVMATSGPGATNIVTGIANAYLDSVPMVAITGNVSLPLLGRDSFQEVDIVGVTQPIIKHNFVVRDITKLEHTIDEAFHIAGSGRRGPVLVDIPKSVQADICEYSGGDTARAGGECEGGGFGGGDNEQRAAFDVSGAVEAIKKSKRPYIYAGGGVLASGAEAELLALSERLSAPVGFSMMGLTALPQRYEMNLGMCGMHGRYAASLALDECDLMIAVGVRFSDRATGDAAVFEQGRFIIHIDIDLAEIGKNITANIDICGDAKSVLTELLRHLPQKHSDEWRERVLELRRQGRSPEPEGRFTPKLIIDTVAALSGDDTIVATDVGQHQMWVMQYYKFQQPRTLLTSCGLGAMGYGMGAAIGGCVARGGQRTVLFTGDGSFGMNLNELATAVSNELPLTIVILNNGTLGMVRQWQTMFFDKRYSQTTLQRRTDFPAIARAFGAAGYSARNLSDLEAALGALSPRLPTVIDCHVDIDEMVLPMIPPGGTVKDIVLD